VSRRAQESASGFTLVEALVVVAVLAAVGLVAVRSSRGLLDRAHFEATQRLLADTRDALVGKAGFVADLGRLPDFDADPAEPLRELLTRLPGVPASALVPTPFEPTLALPLGWRGPYLQLAPGVDHVLDGWARPLLVDHANGDLRLRSLGADGLVGGTGFDTDLELALIDVANGIDLTRGDLALSFSMPVKPNGAPANPTPHVSLLVPDPAGASWIEFAPVPPQNPWTSGTFPYNEVFKFSAVPVGVRVARAYLVDGSATQANSSDPRSAALPVDIRPGAQFASLQLP